MTSKIKHTFRAALTTGSDILDIYGTTLSSLRKFDKLQHLFLSRN